MRSSPHIARALNYTQLYHIAGQAACPSDPSQSDITTLPKPHQSELMGLLLMDDGSVFVLFCFVFVCCLLKTTSSRWKKGTPVGNLDLICLFSFRLVILTVCLRIPPLEAELTLEDKNHLVAKLL